MMSNSRKKFIILSLLIGLNLNIVRIIEGSFVVPIIKVVNEDVAGLGESPYWDPVNKLLYYVDQPGGHFSRLNPATGELVKISTGAGPHVIIPYRNEPGEFIISRNNKMYKLNFETQVETYIAEVPSNEILNDAKCDSRGRLFVGTLAEPYEIDGGNLYRLDGNVLTKLHGPFTVTNGMAFSNDDNSTRVFLNDSGGGKIYHFDYDIETGELTNKRVMIDTHDPDSNFGPGDPDGMVIDEFGFIWVACWNGARIAKIDVDLGQVVDQVELPTNKCPSSLARGEYEGRDGFYITTVSVYIPPEEQRPDDGKIMHVSFQGAQVNSFVG